MHGHYYHLKELHSIDIIKNAHNCLTLPIYFEVSFNNDSYYYNGLIAVSKSVIPNNRALIITH